MLFNIVRFSFCGIAFLFAVILIRKSHMRRKRTWTIIAFIAAVVVLTASALIPVENAFLSFASPEAAYRYNHSGAVMLEINGEKTTFLVGEKGDTYEYAIIPKAKDGWKLGVGSDVDRVVQTVSNGITVQVYQYKKTGEHYIVVQDTNGGASSISDTQNSEFLHLEKTNSVLNKVFFTYYAFINDFGDGYALTVNGKLIPDLHGTFLTE